MNNEVASILEAIKIHAKETPDKLCAGDKKKSATYSEFWDMIQRAATYLKNNGVRKDSIVVIRSSEGGISCGSTWNTVSRSCISSS